MVSDENAEALRRSWCFFEAGRPAPHPCLHSPPLVESLRSFKTASSLPSGATTKAVAGNQSAPALSKPLLAGLLMCTPAGGPEGLGGSPVAFGFPSLLFHTYTGVLQKGDASVDMVVVLARTLSKIKMEDATASKPEDKIMIDTCPWSAIFLL